MLLGNHEMKWLQSDQPNVQPWLPFIKKMKTLAMDSSYLFVHAGIEAGRPLDNQVQAHVTGHENVPLARKYKGHKIIHGHVPTFRYGCELDEVYIDKDSMCIDTGAGHQGYVSLVDLTNNIQYFISVVEGKTVYKRNLK